MKPKNRKRRPHMGWALLLCLAVGITACAPATEQAGPASAAPTEADVAAINRVVDEYAAALNAGDATRIAALATDDAVWMPPGQPAVVGKEAIQTYWQINFDQNTYEISISSEEMVIAGDWAFRRGSGTGMITPKAGGEPRSIDNKAISIFHRQPDESWKITRTIYNRNPPPPGM